MVTDPGPVIVKFEAEDVPMVIVPVTASVMPDEMVMVAVTPVFIVIEAMAFGGAPVKFIFTLVLIIAISPTAKPG